jgi:hypothetical protein
MTCNTAINVMHTKAGWSVHMYIALPRKKDKALYWRFLHCLEVYSSEEAVLYGAAKCSVRLKVPMDSNAVRNKPYTAS